MNTAPLNNGFNDQNFAQRNKDSVITRAIIRLSFGTVRTAQQAQMVLFACIGLCIVLSIVIIIRGNQHAYKGSPNPHARPSGVTSGPTHGWGGGQ